MSTGLNGSPMTSGASPAATAALLLRRAPELARSPDLPEPVRHLGHLVERLVSVYVRLPAALAEADDNEAAVLLADHRRDLDYYLHTPLAETLEPALEQAVAAEGRLAPAAPELLRLGAALRSRALAALAKRGIERLVVTPGSPFAVGEVVPSDEEPLVAPSQQLHQRVARVSPGRGGYRLGDRVVVPAEARPYLREDGLESASEAAS